MVQVFKAELDNVKTVAVKFLSGRDLPTMKQFAEEVDIMRACRDDNVVSFLGAWLQPETLYMCTEFCPHGDLYRALADDLLCEGLHWYKRQVSLIAHKQCPK